MGVRYLRASPRGDGCGIVLLRVEGHASYSFSILPKLWRRDCPSVRIAVELDSTGGPHLRHLYLLEMSILVLRSEVESRLQRAVASLTGLSFEDIGGEDSVTGRPSFAPMFEEIAETQGANVKDLQEIRCSPVENPQDLAMAATFWRGVQTAGAIDLVRTPQREDGQLAPPVDHRLFDDIPPLEQVVRQMFVDQAEIAVAQRKPDFNARVSSLPFIRGSVTTRGVLALLTQSSTRIECEFDELTHDQAWQSVVRAAVRTVASRDACQRTQPDNSPEVQRRVQRCRRLDRNLSDVTLLTPQQALTLQVPSKTLGKNKHAKSAVQLARTILSRSSPAGHATETEDQTVAATGLRISTSGLFERLLEFIPSSSSISGIRRNPTSIKMVTDSPGKRPDLLLARTDGPSQIDRALAVLDAKYKDSAPTSPRQMSMSDQYQQFAYAAVSGKPNVFVFSAEPGGTVYLSPPKEIRIHGVEDPPTIQVAHIPFPDPRSSESWGDQMAVPLSALISALDSQLK